jgi:hypothetical protein
MTMTPQLWPRNPVTVSNDFNARHGPGTTLPNSFIWATWAAEGSDYLEKLDAGHPGNFPVPPTGSHPDLVDISHVRWATANAITAIDLCAATIGRQFCGVSGMWELSLRDFDGTIGSPKRQAEVAARRGSVPPDAKAQAFLAWVDATLADPRYKDLHDARNPFTHSWLHRHLSIGGAAHAGRTRFTVIGTSHQMNARDMVEMSASRELDRVREFVEVVDQY